MLCWWCAVVKLLSVLPSCLPGWVWGSCCLFALLMLNLLQHNYWKQLHGMGPVCCVVLAAV